MASNRRDSWNFQRANFQERFAVSFREATNDFFLVGQQLEDLGAFHGGGLGTGRIHDDDDDDDDDDDEYGTLRIQICPKKWIYPMILLWGWD